MLRAVIFDLDDTLYEYEPLHRTALAKLSEFTCRKLCISERQFQEAFAWGRDETKRLLCNTGASHNRMLYCQKALEYLHQSPTCLALDMYETYWNYMLEHMCLNDGAEELLQYCENRGLEIGICTDLTAHIQHRKLRKLGLSNHVNALVTSEEVGMEKPNAAIYELMLSKLRVLPQEAVFIGDSLEKDVIGPMQSDINAIWLHDKGDGIHTTASSLRKVRDLLYEIE